MLSWDLDLPVSSANIHLRSPMSFHHESQVSGTPFHQPGRMPVKFHNFWTIEAPEGFSVLSRITPGCALSHSPDRP